MKKPKTTNHIVIEVDNPEKADRLFEEIQNKYSLYDNCVIERETPIENSIVVDDRWEENGRRDNLSRVLSSMRRR